MNEITFFVPGPPAPQGSKTYLGKGQMVESSKRVAPFRALVALAASEAMEEAPPMEGPLEMEIKFHFTRPASHFGTGKNSGVLRPSAPEEPTSHQLGDLDKLCRSVLDALTGTVFLDDSQVVFLTARKQWWGIAGTATTVRRAIFRKS